jgi:hypothetical protein
MRNSPSKKVLTEVIKCCIINESADLNGVVLKWLKRTVC